MEKNGASNARTSSFRKWAFFVDIYQNNKQTVNSQAARKRTVFMRSGSVLWKASIFNRSLGNSLDAHRFSMSISQKPSSVTASSGNLNENPTIAIGSRGSSSGAVLSSLDSEELGVLTSIPQLRPHSSAGTSAGFRAAMVTIATANHCHEGDDADRNKTHAE